MTLRRLRQTSWYELWGDRLPDDSRVVQMRVAVYNPAGDLIGYAVTWHQRFSAADWATLGRDVDVEP